MTNPAPVITPTADGGLELLPGGPTQLTTLDGVTLQPGDRITIAGMGPKDGYVRVRVFGREYDIREWCFARWLWGRGWRGENGVYVVAQVFDNNCMEVRPEQL